MESIVFLRPPQNQIRIASWNVNGVKTKLEKACVHIVFLRYDIISLHEMKTPLLVSFPGYVSYVSRDANSPHRDGTCILVKRCFEPDVSEVLFLLSTRNG